MIKRLTIYIYENKPTLNNINHFSKNKLSFKISL